jgi:hypothetical protein
VEQGKLIPGLIEFIYRDPRRIPSFAAQIFGGLLQSVEKASGERKQQEDGGGGELNIAFLKFGVQGKGTTDESTSMKEVLHPHDAMALDVVNALFGRKLIDGSYRNAPGGSIVKVKGTLLFFDPHILQVASVVPDSDEGKKPRAEREAMKAARAVLGKLTMPPMFLLADNIHTVTGTLHDEGLTDPISSFHMRHSDCGMPNVTLIGVKETRQTLNVKLPHLMELGRSSSKFLSGMVMADDAIRVAPLCLFREIVRGQ